MKLFLTAILVLLFLSGCASPNPPVLPPVDTVNTPPSPVPLINNPATNPPVQPPASEESIVPPIVETTPVSGPQTLTMSEQPVLKWTGHADPSVVFFKGKYWMYLNQFGGGVPSGVYALSSADGLTWKKETNIIFDGIATVRALVIGDKIYAYYPQGGAQIAPNEAAAIVGSVSSDGKTFTNVSAIKISPHDGYTMDGPGVFQLEDGSYRMYFVEFEMSDVTKRKGSMWGARSTDGKSWTKDTQPTMDAEANVEGLSPWPQILHPTIVEYNDGFLMLYNSHSRLFWAYSEDGLSWEKRGLITNNGAEIDGADMDAFWLSENELRVYFGDFSHEDGGLVYAATLRVE